jgi:GT2 family glycosyltransferase
LDVSIVIVSYNAREHLDRCLDALAGGPHEVIVVDNCSTDGSADLVRSRSPTVRLVELEANRGFGAANNEGIRLATGRYCLVLNPDAWPVGDGIERLVGVADASRDAGVFGPRLLNEDGTLQPSVRGFPTVWRVATEFLFLRKLAPRSRLLNAYYWARFDHAHEVDVDWFKGAVMLLRREALDAVGCFDPSFFMFSEETDLCYRMRLAGWRVVFTPAAEFVHVGKGSTRRVWGRMFREQLRSHLRFLAKHHGLASAERARRIMVGGLRVRGLAAPGPRGRLYREAAAWLASDSAGALLESSG